MDRAGIFDDDAQFTKFFLDWLFERYQRQGGEPRERVRGLKLKVGG